LGFKTPILKANHEGLSHLYKNVEDSEYVDGTLFETTSNMKSPEQRTESQSGWWFQTFFIFHFIYGIILPIDELIFFKMVIAPPIRKHHKPS
jgi:hypothetical protein